MRKTGTTHGEPSATIKVLAIVEPDGDGFHAYCPAFEGLHMDGTTEDEALQRTIDGLNWYLDSLQRHGDPIPIGPDCIVIGPDCIVEDGHLRIDNPEIPQNTRLKSLAVQWLSIARTPVANIDPHTYDLAESARGS